MPDKQDIQQKIQSSSPDQWEFFDAPETLVYKNDRDLKIERYGDWTSLSQGWLDRATYSNSRAKRAKFRVLYRGSPYFDLPFASVDGYRGIFPIPELDRSSSPPTPFHRSFDQKLGEICTRAICQEDYDHKRQEADIERR